MKEIQQICLEVQVLKPNNSINNVVLDLNLFESELQQSLLYCKHIKESCVNVLVMRVYCVQSTAGHIKGI